MTNHARNGGARERRVRDHLEKAGYPHVMKAGGSKGAFDLIHGHPLVGAIGVQVGTGNKSIGCRNKDHAHDEISAAQCGRDRICEAAALIHALPVLATVIEQRGKATEYRFHVVTRDKPATWREWEITTEREEKQ